MRKIFCVFAFLIATSVDPVTIPYMRSIYDYYRYNGMYRHYLLASHRYGVPVVWIVSLAQIESDHSQDVISRAGAIGVMQLMPETAAECGVNPYVARENIDCGVRVFSGHLRRYRDVDLALAAYNAGPGNVRKFGGIPPFAETVRHIQKFWVAVQKLRKSSGV